MTSAPSPAQTGRRELFSRRAICWCLLGGLFLLILGARLWFIHHFGLSVIYEDDWPLQGALFRREVEGQLSLRYLVSSYHGHRMLFPRLFWLGLFRANGRQWDPLVFMVAQAPLYALSITLLAALYGRQMNWTGGAALAVFAAAMGMIPFGWENAVFGCNVQFPLFTLFGILSIWFCWRYDALSWRWWIGALLALSNLFVLGGGVFPTLATACVLIFGAITEPARRTRRNLAGIVVLLAIVVMGVAFAYSPRTRVVSFTQFIRAFAAILAWPDYTNWDRCFVIQAPLVLLAAFLLLRRIPVSDRRWLPLIVGCSFWIQAAATVHQRLLHFQASRFNDSWMLLSISLAACLYFLGEIFGPWRRCYLIMVLIWGLVFVSAAMDAAFYELPKEIALDQRDRLMMDASIRRYLHTGDKTSIAGEDSEFITPFSIRGLLPPDLLNTNAPLVPALEQFPQDGDTYPLFCRNLESGIPVYGDFNHNVGPVPKGIKLRFNVPKGTREVDMLVAGDVDFDVNGYHIKPMLDTKFWKPVSVSIAPRATSFDISATGNALEGMAFTAPVISTRHQLGLWVRQIAGDSAHNTYVRIMWLGFTLMAGALLAIAGQSLLPARGLSPAELR